MPPPRLLLLLLLLLLLQERRLWWLKRAVFLGLHVKRVEMEGQAAEKVVTVTGVWQVRGWLQRA
jgi:hypothetical protein